MTQMLSATIMVTKKDMNVDMAITSVDTEIATSDCRENQQDNRSNKADEIDNAYVMIYYHQQ